jgi:hypothetical protein
VPPSRLAIAARGSYPVLFTYCVLLTSATTIAWHQLRPALPPWRLLVFVTGLFKRFLVTGTALAAIGTATTVIVLIATA